MDYWHCWLPTRYWSVRPLTIPYRQRASRRLDNSPRWIFVNQIHMFAEGHNHCVDPNSELYYPGHLSTWCDRQVQCQYTRFHRLDRREMRDWGKSSVCDPTVSNERFDKWLIVNIIDGYGAIWTAAIAKFRVRWTNGQGIASRSIEFQFTFDSRWCRCRWMTWWCWWWGIGIWCGRTSIARWPTRESRKVTDRDDICFTAHHQCAIIGEQFTETNVTVIIETLEVRQRCSNGSRLLEIPDFHTAFAALEGEEVVCSSNAPFDLRQRDTYSVDTFGWFADGHGANDFAMHQRSQFSGWCGYVGAS